MPSRFWIVPKLTRSAPMALLRSAISSGAVAMMGDAPSASVAFADWFVTTLLVIYHAGEACRACASVASGNRKRNIRGGT
jgi:hypothetical protein